MSGNRAVIIYSGGMDSFTLLHELVAAELNPIALSFNYGQRHRVELRYAAQVCKGLGLEHIIANMVPIGAALLGASSLTSDKPVPEGHYAEPSMKQTVVPNRNMIMLSMAVGLAVTRNIGPVYTAVHAGDHAIYPDCRPEFIAALNDVTLIANYHPVSIEAPYLQFSKGEILDRGLLLGLDYGQSWTCYNGRELACGKCGSCVERLEAFAQNNTKDPLRYEQ